MPKINDKNRQKIKEQILQILFENNLKPLFTANIAEEIIRDEEFVLDLLNELNKEGFLKKINKNIKGKEYLSRRKWILKSKVYSQYKQLSGH